MSVQLPTATPDLTSGTAPTVSIPTVALHRLDWDTAFFGELMGTVQLVDASMSEPSAARTRQVEDDLQNVLVQAAREGYAHLTLKIPANDHPAVWAAEQAGFRLVDVGLDSSFVVGSTPLPEPPALPIRPARADDVHDLAELSADAFLLSRFWADPFFSPEQAREFHREWLRNLCGGLADQVLVCEIDGTVAGFISCAVKGGQGRIPLIATKAGYRRRGLGRSLVSAALHWFASAGAETVYVKTQAQNYPALALYHRAGFTVAQSELTFRVIPGAPGHR
jgi:ribosomal protein S18 acetylase RimI-like enzyme